MKQATWSPLGFLTGLWAGCLGLLLLLAYTPLQLNSASKYTWLVIATWGLAFVVPVYVARCITTLWLRRLVQCLPWLQAAGTVCLVFFTALGFLFTGGGIGLFQLVSPATVPDYVREAPLLSRGSEQIYEVHLDEDPRAYTKPVRVRYLPALFVWVTPLAPASLDSTWEVRRAAGLDLLAPRYRPAAQADLDSRWYASQEGHEQAMQEAARLSEEGKAIEQKGERWRAQHPAEATHYTEQP